MPLTYTPRKFVGYPYNNIFYQIETDHRAYAPAAVERIVTEKVHSIFTFPIGRHLASSNAGLIRQEAAGDRVDRKALELPATDFGRPRAPAGKWASLIRVIDPVAVSYIFQTEH